LLRPGLAGVTGAPLPAGSGKTAADFHFTTQPLQTFSGFAGAFFVVSLPSRPGIIYHHVKYFEEKQWTSYSIRFG
jgi:hypothetical protein